VTTLNRFPLLGLWAEEAARRLGYTKDQAEALGHAYAVLYTIRAHHHPKHTTRPDDGHEHAHPARPAEQVELGGDRLDVTRDRATGHVRGRVGGEAPQTPRSYQSSVRAKFPPGYYEKLEQAFRHVFRALPPRRLKGRLVYELYDQWKKECGVGRSVDLDSLLEWCREHSTATR
jgi:hypothetical protein